MVFVNSSAKQKTINDHGVSTQNGRNQDRSLMRPNERWLDRSSRQQMEQ